MSINLLIFYIFFILISGFDHNRFKTLVTPYNVLTLPFLLVITFVNTIGQDLGFYIITERSILLFALFTSTFWLGGFFFLFETLRIPKKSEIKDLSNYKDSYYVIMLIIGIISGVISLISNWNGVSGFFASDIENNYGKGLWGHLAIFGYPAIVMLMPKLIIEKKKWLILLFILFILLSIIYQSKSRLFIMLLGGILHYLLLSKKIFYLKKVLRQTTYTLVIGIAIFFSIYLASFYAMMGKENVGKDQIEFIITDRFLNYLVAPVISCSENFSRDEFYETEDIQRIFTVPYNIFALFTFNDLSSPIRDGFTPVSNTFKDNAGTLLVYPFEAFGILGTIIFMFTLGMISYYIYMQALFKSKNILLFSVLMTSLLLGFFGFFYNLLFFYEILLWGYFAPHFFNLLHDFFKLSIINEQSIT